MKPLAQPSNSITHVIQPHTGYPYGECVRASYASLLKLPLKCVPRFDPASLAGLPATDDRQINAERRWLSSIGLDLIEVPASPAPKIHPKLYHLITTTISSPQGELGHRVVGQGGKVAWNPHPGTRILSLDRYLFLYPKNGGMMGRPKGQ